MKLWRQLYDVVPPVPSVTKGTASLPDLISTNGVSSACQVDDLVNQLRSVEHSKNSGAFVVEDSSHVGLEATVEGFDEDVLGTLLDAAVDVALDAGLNAMVEGVLFEGFDSLMDGLASVEETVMAALEELTLTAGIHEPLYYMAEATQLPPIDNLSVELFVPPIEGVVEFDWSSLF